MTVLDLNDNESATITGMFATGGAGERLRSLGFVRGRVVTVLGYSLFRSSVLLACGPVRLAVRRRLAQKIEVRV